MKKYSRSSFARKHEKGFGAGKVKLNEKAADSPTCGSGDCRTQDERNKKAALQTTSKSFQKDTRGSKVIGSIHESTDVNKNGKLSCDNSSIGAASIPLQSTSDSDNTQYDLVSLDAVDASQLSMPLNCVWGNGMHFHSPSYEPTNAIVQLPLQTPPMSNPLAPPIFPMTNLNLALPFPDRSGNVNPFIPMQNSMVQPPPPTLNSSLGFPSVYVSPAGLITVLLKYDIAVEMTVDKNIRVVNHRHKAVAATNNRGSSNCVYHIVAKVFQDGTRTEAEVFGERRARMQTNGILFSSSMEVYLLDESHIVPSQFVFNDMSKDSSINILFTPGTIFTNDLLVHCDEITKSSRYYFHKDGSTTVIINNIKIHQDEFGTVQVTSGPRYISTSPVYGSIYLHTHFVEISVQVNWNVSVQRGTQRLNASYTNFAVSNGHHEAGFNQHREVFSRPYNAAMAEFESWLPSLTYLSQGMPQYRRNSELAMASKRDSRNKGDGDQARTYSV